jgi:hypothetical protein
VSRTVALLLLVCALALPSAGLGATGQVRGGGMLAPGCPIDPVAADLYCPTNPIWFSLRADMRPRRSPVGRFMTRWVVAGTQRSLFAGGVGCMNVVGNTVVVGGLLTNPRALLGTPYVAYAVDNGASGDLVSDLGLFPDGDPDLLLLPVGFPSICPAPGLAASIYGYLPLQSGGVLVRPPTP